MIGDWGSYGSAAMIGVVRVSFAVDSRGISDYDWGIFIYSGAPRFMSLIQVIDSQ